MGLIADLKKTHYYLKRNGIKSTFYAAMERLHEKRERNYCYQEPAARVLQEQEKKPWETEPLFSIIVPAYQTPETYLKEMIVSVLEQSYRKLELVIADASKDDHVERIVKQFAEKEQKEKGYSRICYLRLQENAGITGNSNQALAAASGDYVGLLDHDDILTPDALYEMVSRIEEEKRNGRELMLLYSDEDKCNEDRSAYYEPHFKPDFNLDLLLSNNYICHFLVMKRELIQKLTFRKEYEGAQDYDLVLRAVADILPEEELIAHIPRVLYHWRCHTGSTAENPGSKQYAYEAGLRAVQSFADKQGWKARAIHKKHLGFYELIYQPDQLAVRKDVGAVGGRILAREKGINRRIAAGAMNELGEVYYEGLPAEFSGYMHRATLVQDVEAVDIRCIRLSENCYPIFREVVGMPYLTVPGEERFDDSTLPEDADVKTLSLRLGEALRKAGYRICWDPAWTIRMSKNN